MKIKMIKTEQELKKGTKTVYVNRDVEISEISEEQYNNITSDGSIRFMRNLGGKEKIVKSYTNRGYSIIEIVSTSPHKQNRTIRKFLF